MRCRKPGRSPRKSTSRSLDIPAAPASVPLVGKRDRRRRRRCRPSVKQGPDPLRGSLGSAVAALITARSTVRHVAGKTLTKFQVRAPCGWADVGSGLTWQDELAARGRGHEVAWGSDTGEQHDRHQRNRSRGKGGPEHRWIARLQDAVRLWSGHRSLHRTKGGLRSRLCDPRTPNRRRRQVRKRQPDKHVGRWCLTHNPGPRRLPRRGPRHGAVPVARQAGYRGEPSRSRRLFRFS